MTERWRRSRVVPWTAHLQSHRCSLSDLMKKRCAKLRLYDNQWTAHHSDSSLDSPVVCIRGRWLGFLAVVIGRRALALNIARRSKRRFTACQQKQLRRFGWQLLWFYLDPVVDSGAQSRRKRQLQMAGGRVLVAVGCGCSMRRDHNAHTINTQ